MPTPNLVVRNQIVRKKPTIACMSAGPSIQQVHMKHSDIPPQRGGAGKTFFTFFHCPMNSWWDLPNIWDHKLIRTAASHLCFFSKKVPEKHQQGGHPGDMFFSPDVIFFGFSFSRLRRGNDRNLTMKSLFCLPFEVCVQGVG